VRLGLHGSSRAFRWAWPNTLRTRESFCNLSVFTVLDRLRSKSSWRLQNEATVSIQP